MSRELANFGDNAIALVTRGAGMANPVGMEGRYEVTCYDKDGNIKWEDYIENQVVAEGKIFMFSQLLRTSVTLVGPFMSLINSTGTSVTAGSFVVNATYVITAIGTTDFTLIGAASNTVGLVFTCKTSSGTGTGTATLIGTFSPRDTQASHTGWTEVSSPAISARATVTFNAATETVASTTPGANEVTAGTSGTTVSFSIGGTATIGGCFIVLGTGAVSTLANTSGTLYSAGAFSGGPKAVASGDSLAVTYTTKATS